MAESLDWPLQVLCSSLGFLSGLEHLLLTCLARRCKDQTDKRARGSNDRIVASMAHSWCRGPRRRHDLVDPPDQLLWSNYAPRICVMRDLFNSGRMQVRSPLRDLQRHACL